MKKAIGAIVVLLAIGCAAGCGTSSDSSTTAGRHSSSATSASTATETADVLNKAVGQSAGWNCADASDESCSLAFTVTALDRVPSANCSDSAPPPAGSEIYRLAIDAQAYHSTPAPNATLPPGFVISSDNWYAIDADGYGTKADVAIGCGDFDPGPFYRPLSVGQKGRGSILFALPAGSRELELREQGTPGTWRWALPAA
ncbi:hypothetical protein EF294_03585 [Gordonia oryzae]|uniref:DUF4352 domain-containing protein n=1 Tax=Gordonia oryzae TaxID=2487349 RepID=A0A3N4H3B1_9ACTN|nr:hypothetical protein EF294_03585 [Gordonia oryzae]